MMNIAIHCTSAKQFFDEISPLGNNFSDNESWLFRGQGIDAPLVPSLFRKNSMLSSLTDRNTNDYSELLLAERDILIEFYNIADKRGLTLPDDSEQSRSALETMMSSRGDSLVPKNYGGMNPIDVAPSLIALAQHYGLPTRLLDWTRQSFIAAFFAAESALAQLQSDILNDKMVVWAMHFPKLGKHDAIESETEPLRIITAPSSTNPNLKAQQGVFTYLHRHYSEEANGKYIPLENYLISTITEYKNKPLSERIGTRAYIAECKLRKFTLPASEATELLRLLAKWDVTPSAIYPGYQNIVTDLQMKKLFNESKN